MKQIARSYFLLAAISCAACLGLFAPAFGEDTAGCAIMNCDCDNLNAGLLTGAWRRDCKACEKRLRETCSQYSPPLFNGLRKAGTCEEKCAAIGPNPYPKAAASQSHASRASAPPQTAPETGVELIGCPFGMERMAKVIDGKEFTGCIRTDGVQQGLWTFFDKDRRTVIEIIYKDGQELSRRESPVPAQ